MNAFFISDSDLINLLWSPQYHQNLKSSTLVAGKNVNALSFHISGLKVKYAKYHSKKLEIMKRTKEAKTLSPHTFFRLSLKIPKNT